ncbi:MAG: methyltransferase domain-containing protein [Ignavibacteria bacterium]|nr:methyltransferase domain-containing protein [Ignavibacteria bacterium]
MSNQRQLKERTFSTVDVEEAVQSRYTESAQHREEALCCPVEYDPKLLRAIPQEIVDKDYGCGDPSRYARKGDIVLDLGSGSGKTCYILAQIVGPEGRVLGVDMNQEMLGLAIKHKVDVAQRLGYQNVEFMRARIQDLRLDVDLVDQYLQKQSIGSAAELENFERFRNELRTNKPLIPNSSVTLVVSNCVLNLVMQEDRQELFAEIFRVLKRGGRAVICDIVSDEDVPLELQSDPVLWSGCISGAFREDQFLGAFEKAGFHGIQILYRAEKPWQTINGIEFRSITVAAYKGKQGPCLERNQAVIYKGPWKAVIDDDGHMLYRGERMAVCDKTFKLYTRDDGPYSDSVVPVEPYAEISLEKAGQFNCSKNARRHSRETKGAEYNVTQLTDDPCCGPDGCS